MGLLRWVRAVAVALLACTAGVRGHGLIQDPKPRNNKASTNYNEHSLSGGGVGVNYVGGRNWPNGRWGVCGDPPDGPLIHEAGGGYERHGGNVVTRYKVGQVIQVSLDIRVVHGGSYEMQLCPVPDGVSGTAERRYVTEACFRKISLTRPDGGGTRYWQQPKAQPGIERYSYQLPPGLRARYAVLRWFWTTANSCNPPGIPTQYVVSANMNTCGKGGSNPEVFINCANISVGDKGPSSIPAVNGTAPVPGAQKPPVGGGQPAPVGGGKQVPVSPTVPVGPGSLSSTGSFPIPVDALALGALAGSVGTTPLLLMGNVGLALLAGMMCCVMVVLFVTITKSPFEPHDPRHDKHI